MFLLSHLVNSFQSWTVNSPRKKAQNLTQLTNLSLSRHCPAAAAERYAPVVFVICTACCISNVFFCGSIRLDSFRFYGLCERIWCRSHQTQSTGLLLKLKKLFPHWFMFLTRPQTMCIHRKLVEFFNPPFGVVRWQHSPHSPAWAHSI